METILVQIKNKKAYKLLKNLEDLKLIKLLEKDNSSDKNPSAYFGTLTEKVGENFRLTFLNLEKNGTEISDRYKCPDRRSDESSAKARFIFFGKNHQ